MPLGPSGRSGRGPSRTTGAEFVAAVGPNGQESGGHVAEYVHIGDVAVVVTDHAKG